jgi:hypothetical protein
MTLVFPILARAEPSAVDIEPGHENSHKNDNEAQI